MNLDLYSDRAKTAIQSAQSLALARRHQQFAPEHLLKVLLEERDGLARNLITAAGGDAAKAETAVETALSKRAQVSGGSGQLYLDGDTARVFAAAEVAAKKAGDQFVTTERVLHAIAKDRPCQTTPARGTRWSSSATTTERWRRASARW